MHERIDLVLGPVDLSRMFAGWHLSKGLVTIVIINTNNTEATAARLEKKSIFWVGEK